MSRSNPQSQYERKLARQRQLEAMEAAASGTTMDMELDTSSFAETEGSFLNGSMGRRFPTDDEGESLVGSSVRTNNQTLFQRQPENTGGLNLMDHATGIYAEPTSSNILGDAVLKIKDLIFTQGVSSAEDHNDADDADVYLGESSPAISKRRRATFCSTFSVMLAMFCKRLLSNKKRLSLVALILLSLVIIGYAAVSAVQSKEKSLGASRKQKKEDQIKQQTNSLRFNAILDHVISESVSHSNAFDDTDSPEYHALRWIAYSDEAQLDIHDPAILQRYALAVFYYASFQTFTSLHGAQSAIEEQGKQWEGVPNPGWIRRDHWLTKNGYCSWYGIKCENKNVDGHDTFTYNDNTNVISLNLTRNTVFGTIPPEFKGLEHMLVLDLSHNELKGTFPHQLGRMNELQYLFLNNNQLTGTLPLEMGYMERIRSLHLGNNRLQGTIPTDFNRMYQLRDLGVENNFLNGEIPDLSSCKHLIGLFANKNRFHAFPSHLASLTNLFEIRIEENYMEGKIPDEFMNLHHLEYFHAGNNKLTGTVPDELIQKLSHLKVLDLQRNMIKGTLPPSLGTLSHIRVLNLNHNGIHGTIPHWNHMHGLQSLYLNMNRLTGSLPTGLAAMTSLQEIVVANNRLNGTIPLEIANCHRLQTAVLDYNDFSGTIPGELGTLTNLETLRVSHNKFNGHVPDNVCDLTKVHALNSFKVDCSLVKCDCCVDCNKK